MRRLALDAAGAARCLLIALLAFTAGAKLLYPHETARWLEHSALVPRWGARPAAIGLPLVELAVAGAMLVSRSVAAGALAALFLSLVFSGVHGVLLWRGELLPCTCIGALTISHASRGLHLGMLLLSLTMVATSAVLCLSLPAPAQTAAASGHATLAPEPAEGRPSPGYLRWAQRVWRLCYGSSAKSRSAAGQDQM